MISATNIFFLIWKVILIPAMPEKLLFVTIYFDYMHCNNIQKPGEYVRHRPFYPSLKQKYIL